MSWSAFLDELEVRVRVTELALDKGVELDPELVLPFEPPTGLGPLPEQLKDRAIDVLRKNVEVEQRINEALDSIRRELASSTRAASTAGRSPFGDSAIPQYFDHKG